MFFDDDDPKPATSRGLTVALMGVLLTAASTGCRRPDNVSTQSAQTADAETATTQRRAEAGDVSQQLVLGYWYFYGERVPQDYLTKRATSPHARSSTIQGSALAGKCACGMTAS